MSLQERTLVVRNFDPERTTEKLLKELCLQSGPVRKVVVRSDHAFVEFDDVESVGYTKALLDGVKMFDRELSFEPKVRLRQYSKYTNDLMNYIAYDQHMRAMERHRQQLEEQNRMQMQYQQLMPFQHHHHHQQPPPPYSNQGYPFQQQHQHPHPHQNQNQHQHSRHKRTQPNFQGPQFRNYR